MFILKPHIPWISQGRSLTLLLEGQVRFFHEFMALWLVKFCSTVVSECVCFAEVLVFSSLSLSLSLSLLHLLRISFVLREKQEEAKRN